MKKEMRLFLLLALFLFIFACMVDVSAQNKSYITVRGSQWNNGVVIVDVVRAAQVYRLQCNSGAPGCTTLKEGKYLMVELPENFGMYECRCVEVYPENVDPQKEKEQKLGEYCLIEK